MVDTLKIFNYDKNILNDKVKLIAGMDEVGRGPLAGPVVTSCVIMPYDEMIDGVYDSKKLTAKKREELCEKIKAKALSYSISLEDEHTIDDINILQATKKSMENSFKNLSILPDILLVDAVKNLNVKCNTSSIIKGDATSYAIACASILAKVYRDKLMEEYNSIYPEYDLKNNKGYGTAKHIEALKKYGATPIHRKSFISHLINS